MLFHYQYNYMLAQARRVLRALLCPGPPMLLRRPCPRVNKTLPQESIQAPLKQPHRTTTQSPDRQIKLATAPHSSIPPRHFSLKPAPCCIGYFVVTIPRQSSASSGSADTFRF